MTRVRDRLTYANVTATLALFIALGGTSYAVVSLPRDSVGRQQLRKSSVTSRAIKDRGVSMRDISTSARKALSGQPGPQGPKGDPGFVFHAAVNSAGTLVRGNATGGGAAPGDGAFTVQWGRDVSACDAVATLAVVPGPVSEPPAGRITVRPNGTGVEVRTFDAAGTAADLPFSVAVAC